MKKYEREILNDAIKSGIINVSVVQDKLEMIKKEEILKNHTYDIWMGSNGYWYTYLPQDSYSEKRKQIRRKDKSRLEDAIVDFYNLHNKKEQRKKITLRTLYPEWLKYKSLHTAATASIRRIDNDWHKYYLNDPLIDIPIPELDRLTLDQWIHTKIKKYELTEKAYYNMSIILRQSLIYAVGREVITENPFENLKPNPKLFRKVRKKEDNTQVFLTDEQNLIVQEAWNDFYSNTTSTTPLAILLDFQTGLRLGELVAIKWSDINGKYLHIQRMEVRHEEICEETNTWKPAKLILVEHTKSNAGDRHVYLTKKAIEILVEAKKSQDENGIKSEFVFTNSKGQRLNKFMLDKLIRKYCRNNNIPEKSMHKIRKTYISTLIDEGVNINTIREQSGHENEETTYKNYAFDRAPDKHKEALLEKALSSHEHIQQGNQGQPKK